MKLTTRDEGRWAAEKENHDGLGEWIWAVTDNGSRAKGAVQTKKLCTVLPRPSNGSSEVSAAERALEERLQAHDLATEAEEARLRQALEGDRQSMLTKVNVAINCESERYLAAAVAEYRANRTSMRNGILAEWEVIV